MSVENLVVVGIVIAVILAAFGIAKIAKLQPRTQQEHPVAPARLPGSDTRVAVLLIAAAGAFWAASYGIDLMRLGGRETATVWQQINATIGFFGGLTLLVLGAGFAGLISAVHSLQRAAQAKIRTDLPGQ